MKHDPSFARSAAAVLLLICAALSGLPGTSRADSDKLLDDIEYVNQGGKLAIRVTFFDRVSYLKHFPANRGGTLEVQLQLLIPDAEALEHADREVLLAPMVASVPLVGVTLEAANVLRPTLVLRFAEPTDFKVTVARDGQSMTVLLPKVTYVDMPRQRRGDAAKLMTLEDLDAARSPPPAAAPAAAAVPGAQPMQTLEESAAARNASQARELIDSAKAAMAKSEFGEAMGILAQVLNLPDHPHRAEAEKLFVEARTRRRQAEPPPSPPAAEPTPTAETASTEGTALMASEAVRWEMQLSAGRAALAAGETTQAITILATLARAAPSAIAAEAATLLAQAQSAPETARSEEAAPQAATPPAPAPAAMTPVESPTTSPAAQDSEAARLDAEAQHLLTQGSVALSSGNTEEAIHYFTQLLTMPPNAHSAEAERLLRAARGRAAQTAQADLTGPVIGEPQTLEDVEKLMEQGQSALREGDNNRAIVIYTKVLSLPDHQFMADALEYHGLARQRAGQVGRAKLIYEDYLKRYPKGEGTERVRQRLAELVTAGMKPQQAPRPAARANAGKLRSDTFGSFAQNYNFGVREVLVEEEDDNLPDQPGRIVETTEEDQSLLTSYVSASNRTRSDRYDIRSVFNGTHQKNFLEDDNKDRLLINQMYVDFTNRQQRYQLKLGRQSGTTAGTLGRFDGLLGGYDLTPKLRLNGAAGFPVDLSSKDSIDFDTVMVASNLQFKELLPKTDLLPFVSFQSVAGGEPDRFAVGEEIRFFSQRGTVFQMLDYDTLFQGLNLFYVQGQFNLSQQSAFYATFDYRATPYYSLRNALYGGPEDPDNPLTCIPATSVGDLEDLLALCDVEELREIAKKETGSAVSTLFGASHALSEKLQFSSDFGWARTFYSDASLARDAALPESEDGFSITGRVTASGIVGKAEITILSLTYTDSVSSSETSFLVQNRAPFFEGWRVDTELRTALRNDEGGQTQTRIRPVGKLVYDWKRLWAVEVEIGGEWSNYGGETTTEDSSRYFGSIGYRVNF